MWHDISVNYTQRWTNSSGIISISLFKLIYIHHNWPYIPQPYSDGGIVVSIAAFQAVDPGSIPGHRKVFLEHAIAKISFTVSVTSESNRNLSRNFSLTSRKFAIRFNNQKIYSTRMGFEPTHGDRIGLAVQRLNHSATSPSNCWIAWGDVLTWYL